MTQAALNDKTHICDVCEKAFGTAHGLKQHRQDKHSIFDGFKAYAPWEWDGFRLCDTEEEAVKLVRNKADAWVDSPSGDLVYSERGERYHLVKF